MPLGEECCLAAPLFSCLERLLRTLPVAVRRNSSSRSCSEEREEFEQTVSFLATVPLFRKRLPRAELPRVAQRLEKREWSPGQRLVRQGQTGSAFFLVVRGEAIAHTKPCGRGLEQARVVLSQGDYFGDHVLNMERPNILTISAGGPSKLVTLSMPQGAFEECGLRRWLRIPKRPTVYLTSGVAAGAWGDVRSRAAKKKLPHEEAFITQAAERNENLRALLRPNEEQLQGLAAAAVAREVRKGEVVVRSGQAGHSFFVVSKGSLVVAQDDEGIEIDGSELAHGKRSDQSAPDFARHKPSSMAERVRRKQAFMKRLSQTRALETITVEENMTRTATTQHCDFGPPLNGDLDHEMHMPALSLALDKRADRTVTSAECRRAKRKSVPWFIDGVHSVHSHPSLDAARDDLADGGGPQQGARRAWRGQQPRQGAVPEPRPRALTKEVAAVPQREEEAVLGPGCSFGELSVLYNTRTEATYVAREHSVVYQIDRRHFTACFAPRRARRLHEFQELLEEVHVLAPLLSGERWELACNARGQVSFGPGERVLHQGKVREARLWYVICKGSAVMSQEGREPNGGIAQSIRGGAIDAVNYDEQDGRVLAQLGRAGFFGERSMLRGDWRADVNVDAGPEGMTCLTFDSEILPLLKLIFLESKWSSAQDSMLPSVGCSIEEWCSWKDSTGTFFERQSWASPNAFAAISRTRGLSADADCAEGLWELQKVKTLGRGAYGRVSLVEDVRQQRRYALKTISKGHAQRCSVERKVVWEKDLMLMVDSVFVVRLHRTFQDSQHIYFLLEAALGGSLLDLIHEHPEVLREDAPRGSAAAFYVACMIAALEHLHDRRIVHRDLKPENALLDERGYAKLCDLGFARFVLGKTNSLVGTPDYMAPEIIDPPHTHDAACDWWSLGVLFFELLCGQTPWDDEGISDPLGRLQAIRQSQNRDRLSFPAHFPVQARAMTSDLLRTCPNERLGVIGGAAQVRRHGLFEELAFPFEAFHEMQMHSPYRPASFSPDLHDVPSAPGEHLGLELDDELYWPYLEEDILWTEF